jgi:hypothetical protein
MLACTLHYQNTHQFCLQLTNNNLVTTHILWATICLLIINWSQSNMILEEGYLLKILPFIVIYFECLFFLTVGRYSFYTSKSSDLWLVQNPEFHVKVCFKNLRLYLYHDNIYFHSKNQPTNSLNKIQYNTKCNICTCNSHWQLIFIMNLWFAFYCILLSAFVGWYTEYMKMHNMNNIKYISLNELHCQESRKFSNKFIYTLY